MQSVIVFYFLLIWQNLTNGNLFSYFQIIALLFYIFFFDNFMTAEAVSKYKCQTLDPKRLLKFWAWCTVYKLCVETETGNLQSWTTELWLQGRESSSVKRVKSIWRQHQCPPLTSIHIYICTLPNIWSQTYEHTHRNWKRKHVMNKSNFRNCMGVKENLMYYGNILQTYLENKVWGECLLKSNYDVVYKPIKPFPSNFQHNVQNHSSHFPCLILHIVTSCLCLATQVPVILVSSCWF